MAHANFLAPVEFKFVGDANPGAFEGYGSVFGNLDWHEDVVSPGAFAQSLAQHKTAGTMPAMFCEHGMGGLPVGVWTDIQEDSRGLKTAGKLSGMDTDQGRLLRSLMQDGAMRGQSIGYKVQPGGAVYRKNPTDPKRTLKNLHLVEVSIVRDPSNALATISGIKSMTPDTDAATAAVAAAMKLHDAAMASNYADTSPRDKAVVMNHLRDAHMALTGNRAPEGMDNWKSGPTPSELVETLMASGMSRSDAEQFVNVGFKSMTPAATSTNETAAFLRGLA